MSTPHSNTPKKLKWMEPFQVNFPRSNREFWKVYSKKAFFRIIIVALGIVLIGGMVLEEEIPGFQMNWPRDILIVLGSAVVIPAFGWMQIALIPPILNIGSRGILIQHGQSTKLIVWDKIEKIRIEKSPLGYALLGINLRENSKVSVYGIASKIDTGTLIAFIEVHWTNKIEQSADISIPSEF